VNRYRDNKREYVLTICVEINPMAVMALSSAESMPTNAWRKPIKTTIRSAKKMRDSFIMTYSLVSKC
jgi:hypothetical protein